MSTQPKIRKWLGAALIAVWGLLGLRIGARLNSGPVPERVAPQDNPAAFTTSATDTFSLTYAYADPFLKNAGVPEPSKKVTSPKSTARRGIKKQKPPSPPVFPQIRYKGMIRSDRTVAVLSVDGENVHLHKGEQFKTLRLLHIYADSVRVRAGREVRIFRKE